MYPIVTLFSSSPSVTVPGIRIDRSDNPIRKELLIKLTFWGDLELLGVGCNSSKGFN